MVEFGDLKNFANVKLVYARGRVPYSTRKYDTVMIDCLFITFW